MEMQFKSWREEIKYLYFESKRKKHGDEALQPGGFFCPGEYIPKPWTDKNTNGLTKCIKDFLTFHGHYVIRTNRQGQARIEYIPIGGTQQNVKGQGVKYNSKVSWTKNPEEKAFTDLQASIFGLYVGIEVKCVAKKDRVKDSQIENKAKLESSGGIHLIVPHMEMFWNWYHKELPLILNTKLK